VTAPAGAARDVMEVVPGVNALLRDHGRLFVVIGVFDGLHRGHVYLLRRLRAEAARRAARAAVITFDAHPDEIVRGHAPPLLLDPAERLVRLERAGVGVTVVQHFDEAVRRTPYDAFLAQIRGRVELTGLLMTPDAAFGFERRGTPEAVADLGARVGFDLVVVPPLDLDGRAVRSAEIRAAVARGDLAAASRQLGRSLAVTGSVVRRQTDRATPSGLRAELGFPLPVALPPPGSYPVRIERAWERHHTRDPRAVAAVAIVGEDGRLELARRGVLPAGDRLRVVFRRDGELTPR
jgi:riboflavin kinase/FMN adenylyltransferase